MPHNSPSIWSTYNNDLPSNLIKTMVPLALLVAGTGGMVTSESAAYAKENWGTVVSGINIEHIQALPIKDQLNHIRKILRLNISELANILDVSRPTIYSWIQGGAPKAYVFNKITKLYNTANEVAKLQIFRIDLLMHTPVLLGVSLFDRLRNSEDISKFLPSLKNIAEINDKSRLTVKGSKNLTQGYSEDYSTPLYNNVDADNTKPKIKGSKSSKVIDPDDYSTPFYKD